MCKAYQSSFSDTASISVEVLQPHSQCIVECSSPLFQSTAELLRRVWLHQPTVIIPAKYQKLIPGVIKTSSVGLRHYVEGKEAHITYAITQRTILECNCTCRLHVHA